MDYSKVKFVKTSVNGKGITAGKVYKITGTSYAGNPEITNDFGETIIIYIPACAHLEGASWIICKKDGTSLTT